MRRSKSGPGTLCALVLGTLLGAVGNAPAQLVINEVLYDPPGADGDFEFVELYNAGDRPASLAGLELVFLNGSMPEVERTVWFGRSGDQLGPGAWWVIGEDSVAAASSHADLNLQNGSEALLLRRGTETLDRVAWGVAPDLAEGAPAPDVSGTSLGRIPDGQDRDDNSLDFHALDRPNPGRPNAEPAAFRLLEWHLEPPWAARPGFADLGLSVMATGWRAQQSLAVELSGAPDGRAEFELAPGDTATAIFRIWLDADTANLPVQVGADEVRLPVQVGPARVRLSEVMARPLAGRPEWIELEVSGADSLDLRGWSLADAEEEWRELAELRLAGGRFVVLSSRPEEVALTRPALVLRPRGGWPALNQSDRPRGGKEWADELRLRDPRGAVVDWLRWSARDVAEAGRSLERAAVTEATPSLWIAAPRGASPGAANDAAQVLPPESGLAVSPNPFTPDEDGEGDLLHVALRDPEMAGSAEAEIVDLSGDRVVRLRAARSREVVQWIWDGKDERGRAVAWGAYLLHVRGEGRSWRRLVALGGRP